MEAPRFRAAATHGRPRVLSTLGISSAGGRGRAERRRDVRSGNLCRAPGAPGGVRAVRDPAVPRERREPDELRRQHLPVPAGQHVAVLLRHRPSRAGGGHRRRRAADGGLRRRSHARRHRVDRPAADGRGTGGGGGRRGERAGRRARRRARRGEERGPDDPLPAALPRRAPGGARGAAGRARHPGRRRRQPRLRPRRRRDAQSQERRGSGGDRARRGHVGGHARRGHDDGAPGPARERHRGAGHRDRAGGRRRPVVPGDRHDPRRDAAQPLPRQHAGAGRPVPARLRRRNRDALRRGPVEHVPGGHDVRQPPEGRLPGRARRPPRRGGRREARTPLPRDPPAGLPHARGGPEGARADEGRPRRGGGAGRPRDVLPVRPRPHDGPRRPRHGEPRRGVGGLRRASRRARSSG